MEINKLLQKKRKEYDYSQEEVAKLLGISAGKVGHHETGRSRVDPDQLKKYAELYNVPASYFFNESIDENEATKRKNYIDDLLDDLIKKDMIKDLDNIPQSIVDMIMNAVKLDIQRKMIFK